MLFFHKIRAICCDEQSGVKSCKFDVIVAIDNELFTIVSPWEVRD